MRREILKICQPAKRDAGRGQLFDNGFPRRTAEYAGYDVFQRITIGDTVVIGIKPLVGRDAGIPQHLGAKPYPFAFVLDRDQHRLAVTAAIGAVRGDRRVAKSDPRRRFAAVACLQIGHIHPVGERMVERDIDDPALAGACPRIERLHDALKGLHAGGDITD